MKKPFPSTIVLLSFNEKTISVNNGYIESYRNEKNAFPWKKTDVNFVKNDLAIKKTHPFFV